ncbi:E3 ubiquitin/ISG15 ligase TRIM25-like [Alosa sapidissima]|uniref:E3 ubiquitin/ISG15 ligase TRIM25-like n=1 Tax=Alosa sapidissima TaxID=34773 RepID=UPI001C09CE25|nr:E3 ubiquitin/ISG15 ligase TRIM25-like [Alosa sapidissima]
MADGILEDQDPFSCPICLDPLEDPVTIPCGHSYCMDCIKDCWGQEDHKGVYSCPQCRQIFESRPALNKNTMFAEVVERLKRTSLRAAPLGHCYAGPGDVGCDVCPDRKQKAIKTCLVCVASYCETHFRLHDSLHPGQRHKVIEPTEQQVKFCSRHGKRLDAYCRSDQSFICRLCTTDEHRGHDVVLADKSLVPPGGHRKDGHSTNNHGNSGHKSGHRDGHFHRHGKAGHHTGGRVKTGHGSSGHKRRKHGSGHGKSEHKSDAHGSWHRRSRHDQAGQTGH